MKCTKTTRIGLPLAALLLLGGVAVAGLSAPAAQAQVPFQVSRPLDGQTVRETVYFRMPRAALNQLGAKYIAVTVDDRFRLALDVPPPPEKGKPPLRRPQVIATTDEVIFLWDTKAKDLITPNLTDEERVTKDGPHTVELVLLDPQNKRVGVKKLNLRVGNQDGLQTPAGGVPMTYQFSIGDLSKYTQHTEVEYVGERTAPRQNRGGRGGRGGGFGGGPGGDFPGGGGGAPSAASGGGLSGGGLSGRGGFQGGPPGGLPPGGFGPTLSGNQVGPFSIPIQIVDASYERTTEDSLGGGTYFIRDKALEGTITGGNGSAARLQDVYEFKSRYRTVQNTGLVISNGIAPSTKPGAYVSIPLPELGGGRRRIGQKWETRTPIFLEWTTLDPPPYIRAQNTLEGLEWQDGYQTARIRQNAKGRATIPIFGGAGEIQNAEVELERTIWFSFKAGRIIRMETTVQVSGDAPANIVSAMAPGAGINAGGLGGGGGLSGGLGGFGPGDDGGDFPGGQGAISGGGFGGLQGPQESPKVPAKFKSVTTIRLAK